MAQQLKLKALARSGLGKRQVKQLRAQGVIPCVLYGPHTEPESIGVGAHEFRQVMKGIQGRNVLVDLAIEQDGKTNNRLAVVQDVQQHPVQDDVLHVDFREVSAKEKFRTEVQIRLLGEPVGVKTGGGMLEVLLHEMYVECLPQDLPDVIEVDVEPLEIGQSVHVRDLTPPQGVEFLDDEDQTICIVAAPSVEEATPGQAGAAPTEPEVIGAKKEDASAAKADAKK